MKVPLQRRCYGMRLEYWLLSDEKSVAVESKPRIVQIDEAIGYSPQEFSAVYADS
jgi:hypothetical protein